MELVQRTNTSVNIMATSAPFSIATSQTAETQNSTSKRDVILTMTIAVAVTAVILITAGSLWVFWFRKRRLQVQPQHRSSAPKVRRRSFDPFEPESKLSRSSTREAKPDLEERGAEGRIVQNDSARKQAEALHESPLPPSLLPPPTAPVQETAELPIYITPRSSRRVPSLERRLRAPAELDIYPPSPQFKYVDETEAAGPRNHWLSAACRSSRTSVQQLLHFRKLAELDGNNTSQSSSSEPPAEMGETRDENIRKSRMSLPTRLSKRLSLQRLVRVIGVAELEGSSAAPLMPRDGNPSSRDGPEKISYRRSQRSPLQRVLQSRKAAELEADTEALPVYSHHDLKERHVSPPPLAAKDVDAKAAIPVPHWTNRTMIPVELDASEPERLQSPSPGAIGRHKSCANGIAALAGSLSSSTSSKDQRASGVDDKEPDDASGEASIIHTKLRTEPNAGVTIPQMPDAVEFLDLTSTESESSPSGNFGLENDDTMTSPSDFGTPFASAALGETPVDPSFPAEIISAAVAPFGSSSPTLKGDYNDESEWIGEAAEEILKVHEIGAAELVRKTPIKRHNPHAVAIQSETQRKRPDFITFKKQMTEAERRAKMIAKRRRSRRRTPKSF